MPNIDYVRYFNSAKKNFISKHPPANPKKDPFAYLDTITEQDVLFEPCEAHIYKRRFDYAVSARYHARRDNNESYGDTNHYASTTKDLYFIYTGGSYGVPDEVKGIYNVSTTFRFYAEFETVKAIENDAKPKLAQNFIKSGANFCSSSDVNVFVKTRTQVGADETFRDMYWSYIYLKDKNGKKGKCIGVAYYKEGQHWYRFYENGKAKNKNASNNKSTKTKSSSKKSSINWGSLVATAVVFVLIAFVALTSLAHGWKKFEVSTCASGFSINRNPNWSYSIEELNVKQTSNVFYLEDYFVSEEFGTEYTIKGRFFPMGKVKLAKKSEHYNQEEFAFNLASYNYKVLKITSDMNYVKIYSDTGNQCNTYISIEKRSTPLDITFENANITSAPGIPVICTAGICDVNIIAKGTNTLRAGKQTYTVEHLKQMVQTNISNPLIKAHYNDLVYIYDEIEYWKDKDNPTFNEIYEHYGMQLTNSLLSFTEGAFNFVVEGATTIIAGRKGEEGGMGADGIIVLGGISVKCEGTLNVYGGDGGNGLDASNSLTGAADGGNGGNGGDGICCTSFITVGDYGEDVLKIEGGAGGVGGEPSKGGFGLFGSSGKKGYYGVKGLPISLPQE